jgi:hypothetical protein
MPNIPITINADFTGVTYQNGAWTGTPAFTASPNNAPVQHGNNKIVWTLTTLNASNQNSVPAGYNAGFTSDGIIFKSTNLQPWNDAPVLQPDGTITAADNFQNLSQNVFYYYTTKVQLSPKPGTNGTQMTWSFDPDVENEAGNSLKLVAAK